MVSYLVTTW